ncbi:MAG: alpha-ketoacid dehydrogenase subunit beta [Deltaproteobacteria bacterium]|nr:alpha-ketoacid dehydrogenase subunit beta [Deltaproteobacteria bacterium]
MRPLTYLEAIREAHLEEMARDPRVIAIGEDIGAYGGAFKVTEGLLERFGKDRVIDTPIAESMIVGVSIGAAIRGLRPVAEMQFADFVTCGFSQLVANAATFHYRLEVSVPMVVRLPSGGGVGGGPYHSRNPEAWFTHAPGIKVVAPATPADAKGLLIASIRDPDPVIYLEQKWLYRREKGDVPEGDYEVPLGKARIAREGHHATLVAYANTVPMALEAALRVANDGYEVEVIDLRTLMPWDWQTVLSSVEKTGRLLLASEATRTGGFISEVAATVADLGFELLDAPILRVTALDAPTPAEKGLEDYFRPNADKIERSLRTLLTY